MKHVLRYCLVLVTLFSCSPVLAAETNTVSSTVVTDKAPPTASAPSIVVNNSDVCKSAASASVQTQILGFATGITITDLNCERIKLARSLYGMGMKVAAVSTLCMDSRVFDAMWMAGTPCPFMGKIGKNARVSWEKNLDIMPINSEIRKQGELVNATSKEAELTKIKDDKIANTKKQKLDKERVLQTRKEERDRANEFKEKKPWTSIISVLGLLLLL